MDLRGLGCSYKGQCLSENNVYEAASHENAILFKVGVDTKNGNVRSEGDWLLNGAIAHENNRGSVFNPSYNYNAENAGNNLINKIEDRAGWEE